MLQGWLLDVFAHPEDGLILWILGEDGKRYRLRQEFPVTFSAAPPNPQLRDLWRWLCVQPEEISLSREERRDLFQEKPQTVLAVTLPQPQCLEALFRRAARVFPDLVYYDADIPISVRQAVVYSVRCGACSGGRMRA